jgi:hypothetical protein
MWRGGVIRRGSYPGLGARQLPLLILAIAAVIVLVAVLSRVFRDEDNAAPDTSGAIAEGGANHDQGGAPTGSDTAGKTSDQADESNKSSQGESENSYRFATELHENKSAGYSFRYPDAWKLRTQQTVSRLTSPDRHFVVSFGLGPPGGLPVAYDEFVALLDDGYSNVVVGKVDPTKIGGSVGVVVRGKATGSAGVRVRFLATVLERPNDQQAIGALAATDVDLGKFPRAVREVLASFSPI